jgi:pimeloyl-ACP methyl ester carboxylesterase
MTIEAREIAGRYPELVRSISLFDVVPPEGNQWNGAITNAADALDRFVGECSNERACAAAYPDLRQQILETHRRNQATPETFIEDNPWGPNPPRVEVLLDGDRTLQLVLRALGNGAMGLVPAAIATRDSRTAAGFASYTLVSPDQASWGALLSRDCMTTVGRVSAEALSIEAKVSPHLAFLADDPILSLCAAWKTRPARTRAPGPVGTPTLIVVGALDPFTSPGWAEQTATSFGHATVVELPHTASADSSPAPCIGRVRSAFLADPRRPIRADACAREIPPVRFAGA